MNKEEERLLWRMSTRSSTVTADEKTSLNGVDATVQRDMYNVLDGDNDNGDEAIGPLDELDNNLLITFIAGKLNTRHRVIEDDSSEEGEPKDTDMETVNPNLPVNSNGNKTPEQTDTKTNVSSIDSEATNPTTNKDNTKGRVKTRTQKSCS